MIPPSTRGFSGLALTILLLGAGLMADADASDGTLQDSDTGAPAAAAASRTQAETVPDAIDAADVPMEAEILMDRMREAEILVRPLRPIQEIKRQLDAMMSSVNQDQLSLARMDLDLVAPRQVDDLHTRWRQTRNRLRDWAQRLRLRSVALRDMANALRLAQDRWQRTQADLPPEEQISPVGSTVNSILDEIVRHRHDVEERLQALTILQARVAELELITHTGLDKVEQWRERSRRSLLEAGAPPLWATQVLQGNQQRLVEQLRDSWNYDLATLRLFLDGTGRRMLFQALLFAAFTTLMLALRRSSRTWSTQGEDMATAGHVLNRPLAAAIVLTLMATPLLYPGAPSVVYELNRLLYLLPVLRILSGVLGRRWLRLLGVLAALYIADSIVDLALERSFLQRLLLLLVNVMALFVARHAMALSRKQAAQSATSGHRLRHGLLLAAMLLLVVAALANVIGYVNLAALLTNAVLTSAYLGICLVAAIQVLTALLSLALLSRLLSNMRSLRRHEGLVRSKVALTLRLAGGALWLLATIYFLGLLTLTWEWLTRALRASWVVGSLELSLGSVLAFVIAICIAVLLSRLIRFVLQEDVLPRMPLARGVDSSISLLVHYTILTLGFLVALGSAGIELSRFALLAGALGVGIGFGLQNLVNNFVSGIILIFERPVQIGDRISVGDHLGEVRQIGFRASTIRTLDGAEIIVPNGELIAREITNWTLSDTRRRVEVQVGVAYGTDPTLVLNLLRGVAADEADVLAEPEPRAYFMGFGDSALNFSLRFWTIRMDDWWGVHSKVTVAVNDALKAAGITIPFPQRDLHLRSVDADAAGRLTGPADRNEPDPPDQKR